jgi:hypothetical protein
MKQTLQKKIPLFSILVAKSLHENFNPSHDSHISFTYIILGLSPRLEFQADASAAARPALDVETQLYFLLYLQRCLLYLQRRTKRFFQTMKSLKITVFLET